MTLKTYKILFELIVESDRETDEVITEVNRAAYFLSLDTDIISRTETAFVRKYIICECNACINKEDIANQHKLKPIRKPGRPKGYKQSKN